MVMPGREQGEAADLRACPSRRYRQTVEGAPTMSAWLLHAEDVEALQKSATWKEEEKTLARKNQNVDLSKPLCAVAVASEIDGAATYRTSNFQIRTCHPEAIARVDQRQPSSPPITF